MTNIDYYNILTNLFEYYRDETNYDIKEYLANAAYKRYDLKNIENVYNALNDVLQMAKTNAYNENSSYYQKIAPNIMSELDSISTYYTKNTKQSGNWWYWRIGVPNVLLKIFIILSYRNFHGSSKRFSGYKWIDTYKDALNKFLVPNSRTDMTYANLASICRNIFVMGIIYEDEKLVNRGIDDVAPAFEKKSNNSIRTARSLQKFYIKHPKLPYSIGWFAGKEGIYDDYSFIQHTSIPYPGTYGLEILEYAALITKCAGKEYLNESARFYMPYWVTAFELCKYDGMVLLPYCGRAVETVDTVNQANQIDKYIKEIGDVTSMYNSNGLGVAYVQPNSDIAQFGTDKWRFVVKMSSDRTARYEAFNGQNLGGKHQGNGMTYLYIKCSDEYKYNYFGKLSQIDYPGTTVKNYEYPGENMSQQPRFDYTSKEIDKLHAGGVNCDATHSLACMQNTEFNKAWIYDNNKIICCGYVIDLNSVTTVDVKFGSYKVYLYDDALNKWELLENTYRPINSGHHAIYVEGVGGYIVANNIFEIHVSNDSYSIYIPMKNNDYQYTVMPLATKKEILEEYRTNKHVYIDENCMTYHSDNTCYAVSFVQGFAFIIKADEESDSEDWYATDFWQREGKVKCITPYIPDNANISIIKSDIPVKYDSVSGNISFNSKDLLGSTIKFTISEND